MRVELDTPGEVFAANGAGVAAACVDQAFFSTSKERPSRL